MSASNIAELIAAAFVVLVIIGLALGWYREHELRTAADERLDALLSGDDDQVISIAEARRRAGI